MNDVRFLTRPDGLNLAYRQHEGRGPTLVFLPGYMSDMAGSKAQALFADATAQGRSALLLDYSGCGQSEGSFTDGTLDTWRDDALLLIEKLTNGPVVLIGSSMGGWLMLLIALRIPQRIAGLVGVAAAPDFTQWGYTDEQKTTIRSQGVVYEDNPYGPEPTPTWAGFWRSGQSNLLLETDIALSCPVRLLQGQADADVPWEKALLLAAALSSSDVQINLVKHGDHRLSREGDIRLLLETVRSLP